MADTTVAATPSAPPKRRRRRRRLPPQPAGSGQQTDAATTEALAWAAAGLVSDNRATTEFAEEDWMRNECTALLACAAPVPLPPLHDCVEGGDILHLCARTPIHTAGACVAAASGRVWGCKLCATVHSHLGGADGCDDTQVDRGSRHICRWSGEDVGLHQSKRRWATAAAAQQVDPTEAERYQLHQGGNRRKEAAKQTMRDMATRAKDRRRRRATDDPHTVPGSDDETLAGDLGEPAPAAAAGQAAGQAAGRPGGEQLIGTFRVDADGVVHDQLMERRGADVVEQLRLLLYGQEIHELYCVAHHARAKRGEACVKRYLRACVGAGDRPSLLEVVSLYVTETAQVSRRLPQEEHHRRLPYYRELLKIMWRILINTPYGKQNLHRLKPRRVTLALLMMMQKSGEVLTMGAEMQRVRGGVSPQLFEALNGVTAELVPADAHLQEWLPRKADMHSLCAVLRKKKNTKAFNMLSRGKVKEGLDEIRLCYRSVLDTIFDRRFPTADALVYLQAQVPSTYMDLWREPGWAGV
jgi:hypothetical protein